MVNNIIKFIRNKTEDYMSSDFEYFNYYIPALEIRLKFVKNPCILLFTLNECKNIKFIIDHTINQR